MSERNYQFRPMVLTAAVMVLVAIGASVGVAANAFWRGTGAGAGAGTSGSTVAVALTAGAVAGDLHPGGAAAVSTSAVNSNSATVRIMSLSLDPSQGSGGFLVTGDSPAGGCATASFSYTPQSTGWDVPANSTLAISLPNAVTMTTSAANACQGATVTVYLKAGP